MSLSATAPKSLHSDRIEVFDGPLEFFRRSNLIFIIRERERERELGKDTPATSLPRKREAGPFSVLSHAPSLFDKKC